MKKLDSYTVLEIIKMIDAGFDNLENHLYDDLEKDSHSIEYIKGGMHQLSALKDHLQSFIEGELNTAENNTGE